MNWTAVADILIAAVVIYQGLVFIQGRRAMHMVVGVALAVLFFYFARWTRLDTVSWLLSTMLPYFVFLIIIVFQSEIRRALAHFGQTAFPGSLARINRTESAEEILLSVEKLALNRTGALIVIDVLTLSKGIASKRVSISRRESIATPTFPTSPSAIGSFDA